MAQYPPEILFRFRDVGDTKLAAEIATKNQNGTPINFVYVKGPGVNLLYGPGPTKEGLAYGLGVDPIPEPVSYLDHKTLLDKLGVTFEQINYVVIDHTCFDCPSGMELFPNATVIIEKAAFDQPNSLGMFLEDGTFFPFAREEDYTTLDNIEAEGRLNVADGDYEIAPGIKLYYAPGHTHETNFLAVNTKYGTAIITGASSYTYLHLRYNLVPPPFVMTDAELVLQSYDRIREVMGPSDALLVPGHDMEVYRRFTPVADRIVKVEMPLAEDAPEYEVYALMVTMFEGGGGIFRFADESRPEVYVKNREDAPISCIYVKGPNVELVYGPGASREAMETVIGGEDKFYVDHKTLLSRIEVNLEQINYVVIDHTCFDHPGGVDQFPNATVIVEKAAFDKPNPLGFISPDGAFVKLALDEDYAKLEKIKEEGRLKMVDGDYEIAPGLKMYYAPGHTYETNFLAINTKDGTVIATGDSCYTYLNLKYNLLPDEWVITDADLMLQSYERIRQVMGESDALLVPGHDMDIYKRFPKVADRVIQIKLPHVDYGDVFFMELETGLNMVSLPLKPLTAHTARSFAEMPDSTVVIKLDEKRQKFVGFTPDAPDDGFAIEGGKGYIVNVEQRKIASFVGTAWTNEPPVETAPTLETDSIWAFVVSGALSSPDAKSNFNGYNVQSRNLRTGVVQTSEVFQTSEVLGHSSGYFALASADLSRKSIIQVGDKLEIIARDASGNVVSKVIRTIDADNIRRAYLNVHLQLGEIIPSQTCLLQNYPNPFNPETWIPFALAEDALVTISIYDANGRLVRRFELGQHAAGDYTSRGRSLYWDGRNDNGERVSSGIYFYQLRAGKFTATRKLAITK